MVVDLSHTAHVDSSGLGALVSCLKKTRQAGGDLRIASPTDHVRNVLKSTRLNRVLGQVSGPNSICRLLIQLTVSH